MIANIKYQNEEQTMVEIPQSLIKEVINGIPYYYKGYRHVLNKEKTLEEIIGASRLQTLIVSALIIYFGNLFKKQYRVTAGEGGLHLKKKDNLSLDVAFFKKSDLPIDIIDDHYFEEVPVLVFEIDVSIDISKEEEQNYVFEKTEKLLDFGTEKVIWIFTKNRKIIVAEPNKSWTIDNWDKEIEILNEPFVLEDFLRAEEIIR
jgi:Uma2 family endonuclease